MTYDDPKVRSAVQAHLAASEARRALAAYRHHYNDGVTRTVDVLVTHAQRLAAATEELLKYMDGGRDV